MVSRRQIALQAPPPMGHAVPGNIHHAVSVQMTTWEDMQGLMLRSERIKKAQKIGYPRSFLHQDVLIVHQKVLEAVDQAGVSCLVFPSWKHAAACVKWIKSRHSDSKADVREVTLVLANPAQATGDAGKTPRVYATVYESELLDAALGFWRITGTGISSRFAESAYQRFKHVRVTPAVESRADTANAMLSREQEQYSWVICDRISKLLQRASRQPHLSQFVTAADVFLYPTGMSAIYHCTRLLNAWRDAGSVAFGFLYELTPKLLQTYSRSYVFYGFGHDGDFALLEEHLETEYAAGRAIQSLWCELPSNPLLYTADLVRLRALADRYGFVIVVDETIGTFANVDVLPIADVLVTSLTKAFSGNADVMGGSMVLNPSSPFYGQLRAIMASTFVPEVYALDAAVLEYNSREFLSRVARMNQTTYQLVTLISSYAASPSSVITKVFHPSILPSRANYDVHLRESTPELTPGHGGLFTIEFESEKAASTFFNALDVHKGPSLGACVTLAQPYVQTVFAREKEWAAYYGLSDTIVRISVGLEDPISLARAFRKAFSKANWLKQGSSENPDSYCVQD